MGETVILPLHHEAFLYEAVGFLELHLPDEQIDIGVDEFRGSIKAVIDIGHPADDDPQATFVQDGELVVDFLFGAELADDRPFHHQALPGLVQVLKLGFDVPEYFLAFSRGNFPILEEIPHGPGLALHHRP